MFYRSAAQRSGDRAALAPELAAALRGVACATRAFSRSQRVVRTGGLKCNTKRTRPAAGASQARCCAWLACLLGIPSVLHAASLKLCAAKAGKGKPRTLKLFTLTQQISATKYPHRWRPSG